MAQRKQRETAEPDEVAEEQSASNVRVRYTPKTPDQVVLEQINKQQRRVDQIREDLAAEEHQLERLNRAKRALEAD